MPRIDSHFHIWDLEHREQDWMTPEFEAVIGGPYDIDDWAEASSGGNVDYGIFMQTVGDPTETPEVLEIASRDDRLIGVTGWVDTTSADEQVIGALLDELLASTGGDALVGVRVLAEYREDPNWLDSAEVHAAARALAVRDLTLDLLTKPEQLPAAARLVAANPQTRFVLDHMSKPTMRDEDYDAWAEGISAVAAVPQVACKFSGFLTFDAGMTAERLRPYYEHMVASFGTARILFGSDWPVDMLGGGYRACVQIVEELTADLTEAEREQIWSATALAWYPAAARKLG